MLEILKYFLVGGIIPAVLLAIPIAGIAMLLSGLNLRDPTLSAEDKTRYKAFMWVGGVLLVGGVILIRAVWDWYMNLLSNLGSSGTRQSYQSHQMYQSRQSRPWSTTHRRSSDKYQ